MGTMTATCGSKGRRLLLSLLILLTLAFLLSSCEDERNVPKLSPLNSGSVILAFGDSLTYGSGAGEDKDYPQRLSALTGLTVLNRGMPGEMSAGGLSRLPRVLEESSPDLLILIHGGNDILRRRSHRSVLENVKSMIAEARKRGIEVVLFGVPGLGVNPDSAADFYEEAALEFGVPYDSTTIAEILTDPKLKSDLVHPNAAGYMKLATAVADLLKEAGAL